MQVSGKTLEQLLETEVSGLGYEFVGSEWAHGERARILRIYIDKPDGITLDDCQRVSQQVSAVLDVEDPVPGSYNLEVSSPGLDRPLMKPQDYERFAGSEVKIRMRAPVQGRRNFKGQLLGLANEQVTIRQDGQDWILPVDDIERARLVPVF